MTYSHRVADGAKIRLNDFDPEDVKGLKRDDASTMLTGLMEEMVELQELLYASAQKSVLIVLQGRDTSGKDGTIRNVTGPLNSQGCEVASFKVPTPEELSHDFLWRIHAQTPKRGHITVFNRSHYEDILVARVHNLVDESVWRGRFDHINNFERLLADSGTIILKFYLHISKEEQKERLLKRE
ncbi:MAG: polyphosphate kinase 2 family protein, partial [Pyrinomonadaceae bacterium]